MKHIVVIDDDVLHLKMISTMLAPEQYKITTFSNSYQALEAMGELLPDLILIDLALPEMNGYELFHRIQQHEGFNHIPIVAISAQVSSNTKAKCQETGFGDLIVKPIDMVEFRSKVAHYLNTK